MTGSRITLFADELLGDAALAETIRQELLRISDGQGVVAQQRMEEEMRCPTCDSPSPNMHPSVQCEGETEPCVDRFHDADDRQSEWLRLYIAEKRDRAVDPILVYAQNIIDAPDEWTPGYTRSELLPMARAYVAAASD